MIIGVRIQCLEFFQQTHRCGEKHESRSEGVVIIDFVAQFGNLIRTTQESSDKSLRYVRGDDEAKWNLEVICQGVKLSWDQSNIFQQIPRW